MARDLDWRRDTQEFVNGVAGNFHTQIAAQLADGETLTRLRFNWMAFHSATSFTAEGVGFSVVLAAMLRPTADGEPPDPFLFPNDDWIWWEVGILVPRPVWEGPGAGSTEIDVAPSDGGGERDVKAQRKADPAGSTLWFVTANTNTSPTQSNHWLTLGWSAGVLLPPVAS